MVLGQGGNGDSGEEEIWADLGGVWKVELSVMGPQRPRGFWFLCGWGGGSATIGSMGMISYPGMGTPRVGHMDR